MASAHSTSVQSSIHEKDKGRATDARQGEKLMDGRHHRRESQRYARASRPQRDRRQTALRDFIRMQRSTCADVPVAAGPTPDSSLSPSSTVPQWGVRVRPLLGAYV